MPLRLAAVRRRDDLGFDRPVSDVVEPAVVVHIVLDFTDQAFVRSWDGRVEARATHASNDEQAAGLVGPQLAERAYG